MFRKYSSQKRRSLPTSFIIAVALCPSLSPGLMLSLITIAATYRIYEYGHATNFPETTPPKNKKLKAINDHDMLDSPHATGTASENGENPTETISDDKKYLIYFGRKPGFEDIFRKLGIEHSPLSHSAIVVKMTEDDKYLIIGRQSPCDTLENPGSLKRLMQHGIQTTPCNEKFYGLFREASFQVCEHGIEFSGAEIKNAINLANEAICKSQTCNMLTSNCYSFSTYVLSKLMVALDKRSPVNQETTMVDIRTLSHELQKAALQHKGVGIINNSTVMEALKEANVIANKHSINPTKGNSFNP